MIPSPFHQPKHHERMRYIDRHHLLIHVSKVDSSAPSCQFVQSLSHSFVSLVAALGLSSTSRRFSCITRRYRCCCLRASLALSRILSPSQPSGPLPHAHAGRGAYCCCSSLPSVRSVGMSMWVRELRPLGAGEWDEVEGALGIDANLRVDMREPYVSQAASHPSATTSETSWRTKASPPTSLCTSLLPKPPPPFFTASRFRTTTRVVTLTLGTTPWAS